MDTASLRLRIYDGARQPFTSPVKCLVRIIDGTQKKQVEKFYSKNDITFDDLPFYDNTFDNYTVIVTADGYRDAGFFPVRLHDDYTQTVDIMLVAKQPGFSFASATWELVSAKYPLLSTNEPAAAKLYGDLAELKLPLACMLNLFEAAADIPLQDRTPLDYIKAIYWGDLHKPLQDRLFCWCDAALIDQMLIGQRTGLFDPAPSVLHPGATRSWKEIRSGEANLQLTFHEKDKQTIAKTGCILLELDIDYYKSSVAHVLLEVLPNSIGQSLTDPVMVYILRWMAGRQAKTFDFEPLYTLTDDQAQPAADAALPAKTKKKQKTLKRR